MEFLPIVSAEDSKVQQIYTSYTTTFPIDEQREHDKFMSLFSNPNVQFISVIHESEAIGYFILWKLSSFVFLEHFEVFEVFRNKKLGSSIMRHLSVIFPNIVLEIEPAELNEDASKRYSFYRKNNFSLIDATHIQPSYGEGKKSLNLWLLANYTPENIDDIKKEIYKVIYS